jgi:hypothetical protein
MEVILPTSPSGATTSKESTTPANENASENNHDDVVPALSEREAKLEADTTQKPAVPDGLKKFVDQKTGHVDPEKLAKAYLSLESEFSRRHVVTDDVRRKLTPEELTATLSGTLRGESIDEETRKGLHQRGYKDEDIDRETREMSLRVRENKLSALEALGGAKGYEEARQFLSAASSSFLAKIVSRAMYLGSASEAAEAMKLAHQLASIETGRAPRLQAGTRASSANGYFRSMEEYQSALMSNPKLADPGNLSKEAREYRAAMGQRIPPGGLLGSAIPVS